MNAGRAALLRVLQRTRAAFVAARLEVTPRAVYFWAEGHRLPSARAKKLLEVNYGIPLRLWAIERVSTRRRPR